MLLLISATITGCGDDSGEKELSSAAIAALTPAAVTAPAVAQKGIAKKYTPTAENCGPHYEHQYMLYEKTDIEQFEPWQSCFPREAPLDNKEFWSEPRIMFSLYKPDYKDQRAPNPSLHSMRFDGTDIRLILRSDEIAGDIGHGFMYHRAVRSPNNRYIALSFDGGGGKLTKVLFDLQKGSRTVLVKGGAKSNFIWTHDSENLIFYVDDRQKNYHIPTKTLTDRKIVYSSGGSLYLLNDGKTFMAARYNRLDYSDFDGNKFKTIQLPNKLDVAHGLSLDNSFFYFSDAYKGKIYDIKQQKTVYTYENQRYAPSSDSMFLPRTSKIIFFHRKKGLVKHNFATDEIEILFPKKAKGLFGIRFPSIINHPLLSGATPANHGGTQ